LREISGVRLTIRVAGQHFRDLPFGIFCLVHGGVGSVEESVLGCGVLRIEGDADAGGGREYDTLDWIRFVEATFEAKSNLLNIGSAVDERNQDGKFVAAETGERVLGA
jgi:hypothetical protein